MLFSFSILININCWFIAFFQSWRKSSLVFLTGGLDWSFEPGFLAASLLSWSLAGVTTRLRIACLQEPLCCILLLSSPSIGDDIFGELPTFKKLQWENKSHSNESFCYSRKVIIKVNSHVHHGTFWTSYVNANLLLRWNSEWPWPIGVGCCVTQGHWSGTYWTLQSDFVEIVLRPKTKVVLRTFALHEMVETICQRPFGFHKYCAAYSDA